MQIFRELVDLNFFGDKHGKNSRDLHFSHLTRFVEAESLLKKLEKSQDIVDAINKRRIIANENKKGFYRVKVSFTNQTI